MATHQIEIQDKLLPDASGNVYWAPSSVDDANDLYPSELLVFKRTTAVDVVAAGRFRLPLNFVSAPVIGVDYDTTGTSGKVVWQVTYKAITSGESIDPSAVDQTVSVNPTVPGTARLLDRQTMALTAGNFAAGDEVQWALTRLESDTVNDTLTSSARVRSVVLSYSDV